MALFGGAFGQGFVTGLAKSVDKAVQGSIERVRDNIDEMSKAALKRETKAIEETERETKEIMKELRAAQSVLGGVNDDKSAGRAAALFKQVGNLNDFKSIVQDLNQFKSNMNATDYDFTNYFDEQNAQAGVNLADVARNYVIGITPARQPIPDIKTKGGGIAKLFGADVSKGSRGRVESELAALGLTRPVVKDVVLPDIVFKSEELKLDKMGPEAELKYLREKIIDPDTDTDKLPYYQNRVADLSARMGTASQLENALLAYQIETDATEKAKKLKVVQNLSQAVETEKVLISGDQVEITKHELEKAYKENDIKKIDKLSMKLVKMGGMTIEEVTKDKTERLKVQLLTADNIETQAINDQIAELQNYNARVDRVTKQLKPATTPTPTGVNSFVTGMNKVINLRIANNPEFIASGVVIGVDGELKIGDKGLESDQAVADRVQKFREQAQARYIEEFLKATPKDGNIKFVAGMLGITIDDSGKVNPKVNTGITTEDIIAGSTQEKAETEGTAIEVTSPDYKEEAGIARDAIAATKRDFGDTLNSNNLRRLIGAIKLDLDNQVVEIPNPEVEGASTERLNDFTTEDLIVEITETVSDVYGSNVAVKMKDQIVTEANKIMASTDDDIPIKRMGRDEQFRRVRGADGISDYYMVGDDGELTNLPVKRGSTLYEQLESTFEDPADRDEATVDLSQRLSESDAKIAALNPDVVYNPSAPDVFKIPYRRIGNKFFRINEDGSLSKDPADNIRTTQLLEATGGAISEEGAPYQQPENQKSAPVVNEKDEEEFDAREASDIDRESRIEKVVEATKKPPKSEFGELPERERPSNIKAASDVYLIGRYANGEMTVAEANELKRRVENDGSGALVDQISAIINKMQE